MLLMKIIAPHERCPCERERVCERERGKEGGWEGVTEGGRETGRQGGRGSERGGGSGVPVQRLLFRVEGLEVTG